LLAARYGAIRGRILGPHDDRIRAGLQQRSDIEDEGHVASFMAAGEPAVHPNHGAILDGAEVQEHVLANRLPHL